MYVAIYLFFSLYFLRKLREIISSIQFTLYSFLQENGAAAEAGGLEVGQLILEVDRQKVEGKNVDNFCLRFISGEGGETVLC